MKRISIETGYHEGVQFNKTNGAMNKKNLDCFKAVLQLLDERGLADTKKLQKPENWEYWEVFGASLIMYLHGYALNTHYRTGANGQKGSGNYVRVKVLESLGVQREDLVMLCAGHVLAKLDKVLAVPLAIQPCYVLRSVDNYLLDILEREAREARNLPRGVNLEEVVGRYKNGEEFLLKDVLPDPNADVEADALIRMLEEAYRSQEREKVYRAMEVLEDAPEALLTVLYRFYLGRKNGELSSVLLSEGPEQAVNQAAKLLQSVYGVQAECVREQFRKNPPLLQDSCLCSGQTAFNKRISHIASQTKKVLEQEEIYPMEETAFIVAFCKQYCNR